MAAKSKSKRVYFGRTKRHYHKPGFTLPLAVVAGFAAPVSNTIRHGMSNGISGTEGAIGEFSRTMVGFNPYDVPAGFQLWRLRYGLLPVLLGLGLHKLAGVLGINRMLARSGIPIIRL